MGKVVFLVSIILLTVNLDAQTASDTLTRNCLACHQKQKIPSELMYRRYLLKYSSKSSIQKEIFFYLENPQKENSIMPNQFFLKFPMKEKLDLNATALEENIEEYLDFFDVKKDLVLEEKREK